MTLEQMREAVFEKAQRLTDADCVPIIIDVLDAIVDSHQRAGIWTASTAYGVGDVVQLYPRTGRRYLCITAGTSGTTFPVSSTYYGYSVTDGDVYWRDDGADYPNVYEERAILQECCQLKVAKSSVLIDQTGISASQLQAHWTKRALEYAPTGIA